MKKLVPVLTTFFLLLALAAAQAPLKISDVVDMVKGGISEDLVMTKLHKANQPFDLTAQQMLDLRKQGVSDNIIKVMMDPAATPAPSMVPVAVPVVGIRVAQPSGATPASGTSEEAIAASLNNPGAPHDSGIYACTQNRNNETVMVGLERAAAQATKMNMLGHIMTGGVLKAKIRAVIPSPKASIRINELRPTFYFYFEDKSAALGKSGFGASQTVSNPNQFALIKLEEKKASRETVTGEIGFGSVNFGTDPKSAISFRSEQVRSGVYRVIPAANMEPGEYAFISASATGMVVVAGTGLGVDIFDFAVAAQ